MNHAFFMQQALAAARQSLYITSPNPRVGCVIVHHNQIIARGATQMAGGAHAEVMAIRQAQSQGFTAWDEAVFYVTLEPCSHHGRTPPCVEALIALKPKQVVIAMLDPNPIVAGRGVQQLRTAGIEVVTGVETEAALVINVGFVSRMVRNLPWVWLKTASSLDGRTALANGESKWITGAAARLDGQQFRARSCVVLTGIGTVLADDPQLNVRDIATPRQPIRAVIDSQLRFPLDAKMLDGHPVWIFTCVQQPDRLQPLADKNAQVVVLNANAAGQVDLHSVMRWLAQQQINEVHVEAGARLNGALLQAGYVDSLISYIAPVLLGEGRPVTQINPLSHLDQAYRFELLQSQKVGDDVRLIMRQPQSWHTLLSHLQQLSQ